MRALVYSSLFPNSVTPQFGIFVHRRAEALAKRGVEVRVVAPVPFFPSFIPHPRWSMYSRVPKRERLGGIPVTHPRYIHFPGPGMYLQASNLFRSTLQHLRQIQKEFPFEFIDAHYIYPDGVAAVHLAHQLGVPCVLTARGSDINVLSRYREVRRQIKQALNRADAIVSVSSALANEMLQLGAPDRIRVIPNGIDQNRFHYRAPSEARKSLNIFSDEKMLLSVGNLNELKGHSLIIEAVALLKREGLRMSLHIFGEGEQRTYLQNKIQELGLKGDVELHGSFPNERLGKWYQAASLFVLASSREGWPNVLNEALACGLPVVATAVGGVPEIISEGENGFLTNERTAESLAQKIKAGLQKDWDREHLAQLASKRGWSDVASQLVEVFAEITGRTAIPTSSNHVELRQSKNVL